MSVVTRDTKVCAGCGRERLLMFFHKMGKGRLHARCVDCRRTRKDA